MFGIPAKTGDDHVHPYQQLRIRAELANGSSKPLVVQRLKRNKDALRDENDTPIDEVVLTRLLGSVDRKTFERVFGLDHERLREAGQALLEGGGDVGESLFDAGAGGQSVRRVLETLEEEPTACSSRAARCQHQRPARALQGRARARTRSGERPTPTRRR